MSSMYHEVLGSFADVPAVIRVNGASLDSTVSLSFLHNFNVPRSICNHDGVAAESSSGPVRVPTVDGWYNSRQIFRSVYLKGCDVELGCDWLAFVNARFDGYRFLRPLETDLARLCAGHTWNFEAGATQAGSLSVTQAGSSSVTQAGSSSSSVTEVGSQRKDRVVDKFFDGYENLRRPDLSALAVAHGLSVDDHLSIEDLREIISRHVGMGLCSSPLSQAFEGCILVTTCALPYYVWIRPYVFLASISW